MSALTRLPCPRCGALNLAQDQQCLGCGCRFNARPQSAPAAAAPRYAPDEMCMRCFGVLLPAAQFDTSNTMGGIDGGTASRYVGGIGGPAMAARELSGLLWLMDFVANLLWGHLIAKNFQRRLKKVLKDAPNSLCCPSCRAIVPR